MARVEGSVEIAAPREVVWAILADPRRHSDLGTFVAEVTITTTEEVGEGTVYRERSGPGFMKSASEWTITKFDPPREVVHETREKSMTARAVWTLSEPRAGSTHVDSNPRLRDDAWFPRARSLPRRLVCFAHDAEGDKQDVARPQTDSRSPEFSARDLT